ncbi:hypothetical protein OKW42_004115 [Paraburkholderia sp. WC7.3d]
MLSRFRPLSKAEAHERALHCLDKVGLAAVIVIGLLVEHLVFDTLERVTVRRWGVQQ